MGWPPPMPPPAVPPQQPNRQTTPTRVEDVNQNEPTPTNIPPQPAATNIPPNPFVPQPFGLPPFMMPPFPPPMFGTQPGTNIFVEVQMYMYCKISLIACIY